MRARWPRRRRRPPAEPELAAALLEHVSEPLVACDAEGRIVVVNEPARRLQGEADEGCSAYLPGAVVPLPDDQMPLWRALRGEQVRDVALDVQPRGAARRSLNVSGWPVRGRGGRLLGAIVVMRESADDPERRLPAAILDHIGEAVGLVRASDGVLVYVNTTWERMFGYWPGELIGWPVSMLNAAGDTSPQERAEEILGSLERTGRWQGETENVRKDGTRFWTAATVSRFEHHEHGTVWIAAHTDITERKAAELALQEAEQRFRAIFEDGPVGVVVLDPEGRVVEGNASFSALTGYRREEIVGMTLDDVTYPDDRGVGADLAARVLTGELSRYRVVKRLVTKRAETVLVAVTATVIRDPGGRPVYGLAIVEDTAARRAAVAPEAR